MRLRRTGEDLPAEVRAGVPDKPLAWAHSADGWLVGTRTRFVGPGFDLAWHEIEKADWDRDTDRLTVVEVGSYGERRGVHVVSLAAPGHLLELVRERITASVLLQRRVIVEGKRGFWVIARRDPEGGLFWVHEYDAGIDPDDPVVVRLAEAALRAAHDEVGA